MRPKICIIIPVYKAEPYIHRCVDSILAQTYSNFELVLVDDGSPDNCGAICDEYAAKDDRIYVIHQDNTGQAVARNHGLDWLYQNSTAEWIMFVDSDDWIHSETIEYLYCATQQYHSKIAICGYEKTDGSAADLAKYDLKPRQVDTETFFCQRAVNAIIPVGKLYHKSLFFSTRFPNVRACEDEFVIYKILFQFSCIPFIEAPLYEYFMSPDSTMRKAWNPARLNVIEAFEEQIAFFKGNGYQKAYEERLVHCTKDMFAYAYSVLPAQDFPLAQEHITDYKRKIRYNLIFHHRYFPLIENAAMYSRAFFILAILAKLYKLLDRGRIYVKNKCYRSGL